MRPRVLTAKGTRPGRSDKSPHPDNIRQQAFNLCATSIDDAIQFVEKNSQDQQQRQQIFLSVGKSLIKFKTRFHEGVKLYQKLTDKYPKVYLYPEQVGRCLAYRKDYENAFKAFKEASKRRESDRHLSFLDMGACYYQKGDYDSAQQIFENVIHNTPDCSDALLNIGLCYKSKGEFSKAIEYYNKALEVATVSNESDIYNNIGTFYFQQGNYPEAIVNFLKGLDAKPTGKGLLTELDAEILSNLGNALVKEENYDYAWLAFDEAVRLHPENKEVVAQYVINLLKTKNFEKFDTVLKNLNKLDSTTRKSFQNLKIEFKQAAEVEKKATVKKQAADVLKRITTGKMGALKFMKRLTSKRQPSLVLDESRIEEEKIPE